MKLKKIIWITIGVALVVVLLLRLRSNKDTTQEMVYHYDKEKPIVVGVDTIRIISIDDSNAYTGTFEPNKETKISSEVQGKINSILVDLGHYVSRGQPLIQLDNSLLKLQLQSVEVQIEGLEDDVKRFTILTQADAVRGVQLEKASLGLKSAKVQKATLMEQINKTIIRAPFNGVVTAKFNEEGAFAAPGIPLLQITDISNLRFTVNVPENDLNKFQSGRNYSVSADVFPDTELTGRVTMVGSKANIGNSFPVQLQVANTKNLSIKSGMFGKVNLISGKGEKGILIPSSAIMESGGKPQVYLVKGGKAIIHDVTISRNLGNQSVVSEGLQEGNVIITSGFINLSSGMNVSIKN